MLPCSISLLSKITCFGSLTPLLCWWWTSMLRAIMLATPNEWHWNLKNFTSVFITRGNFGWSKNVEARKTPVSASWKRRSRNVSGIYLHHLYLLISLPQSSRLVFRVSCDFSSWEIKIVFPLESH
jgi:hypothetical protein